MADQFQPDLEQLENDVQLPTVANVEAVKDFLPPKDRTEMTAKMAGAAVRQAAQAIAAEIGRLVEDAENEFDRVIGEAKTFADDVVRIGGEHASQIEHALMQIRGIGERIVEERRVMAGASYLTTKAKNNGDGNADSGTANRG